MKTSLKIHFQGFLWSLLLILGGCNSAPESGIRSCDRDTQLPVIRHSQLDSVLAQLRIVPFADLDPQYLQTAGIEGHWRKDLSKKTWYAVMGEQANLNVVGRFKLRDFMAHDAYVLDLDNQVQANDQAYFCIDRRVLHKLLDLLQWMQAHDYDTDQVMINYGFRHPSLNARAGGAPKSRHQWGEAIDLLIGDVNRDGKVDEVDKKPLLEILESKIIGRAGGVGRYPGSPVIHIDVRGFKARWDHQ